MPRARATHGYSLLEVVFVAGLSTTLTAAVVPQVLAGLDDFRAAGAAHYVAARLQRTRMDAIMRTANTAMRFTPLGGTYSYAEYVDGNHNGVLAVDIASGVDREVRPAERLSQQFTGVDFGAQPGLPPIDSGGTAPGSDPIRLGVANSVSFTPLGTSSAGTLYILGRGGAQYAVRIFGETGKTRLLKFERRTRRWRPL
jgi:Tfp pilus assembly protein FimT